MNITRIDLISPSGTHYATLFDSLVTTGTNGTVQLPLNISDAHKACFLKITGDYMGRTYTGKTKDDFAIRPMAFALTIPQNNIAGTPFRISLQAIDALHQPTAGYSETISSSFDLNFTEQKPACVTGSLDLSGIAFSNGNATHTTYYTEAGMLDFNISEIAGSEFAVIDADDTPDSQRYISAAESNDINFSIDHFDISALDFINGSTTFTYYAAPADMQLMASRLTLQLQARNALGNITRNYTGGCYAKDVMLGIYFDTNSTPVQSNLLAWQEDGNASHGNPAALSFSGSVTNQSFVYDIAKERFIDGENNTSIKINFNRSRSVAKEPMRLTIQRVAAVNSDNRTGTKTQSLSNDFYYGRMHASDYMAIGNRLDAKIFYEVYCDACDRQNLFTLASQAESVAQVRWYRLDDYLDGVSGFSSVTGTHHTIPVSSSAGETVSSLTTPGAVSNGTDNITFTIPHEMLPFTDRIRYLPKPWLIYQEFPSVDSRHAFNTDLVPDSTSWAGKGDTGGTVDLNVSGRKSGMKLDW